MNFKLNILAAAALMAASAPSFAIMASSESGNGELLVNLRFYSADNDNNNGGNDISGVFDLGVTMDHFIANRNTRGFTMSWDLRAPNYGGAWDTIMNFATAAVGNTNTVEYNVIALDRTNFDVAGGSRYLTTANVTNYPSLPNLNLQNFVFMDSYVTTNNARGTHPTQAHGASTATSADPQNTYFGKVDGGLMDGDTWAVQTTVDTTRTLATPQNFWFLTTSAVTTTAQALKRPFGVDFNGNNANMVGSGPTTTFTLDNLSTLSNTGTEFGKWSFNGSVITFANPVPEAETYAMMLAGLGLVGYVVARRRKQL